MLLIPVVYCLFVFVPVPVLLRRYLSKRRVPLTFSVFEDMVAVWSGLLRGYWNSLSERSRT